MYKTLMFIFFPVVRLKYNMRNIGQKYYLFLNYNLKTKSIFSKKIKILFNYDNHYFEIILINFLCLPLGTITHS